MRKLLENGRIDLSWLVNPHRLELQCRSHLVENHWSLELWGSDQNYNSQWKKRPGTSASKVTIRNSMDPAVWARPTCSSQHMSRPVWSLPLTLWMIQRRHRRRSDETKRHRFGINSIRCVWRKEDEDNPKNKNLPTVKRGVEACFGVLFCTGDRTAAPYWEENGLGHVSWDFGQQPSSLCKLDGGKVFPICASVYQVIIFPTVWRHQTQQYRAEGCSQSILGSHDLSVAPYHASLPCHPTRRSIMWWRMT